MSWLKISAGLDEHPEIDALSDREFRQLISDACAYARGERDSGPELLEEYGLVKYALGIRRHKWNRERLWQKFRGICHVCGDPVPFERFHVEHVIPLARGGKDSWSNLNIAHPACNLAKGIKLPEEIV